MKFVKLVEDINNMSAQIDQLFQTKGYEPVEVEQDMGEVKAYQKNNIKIVFTDEQTFSVYVGIADNEPDYSEPANKGSNYSGITFDKIKQFLDKEDLQVLEK